jgi:hypothetical protein
MQEMSAQPHKHVVTLHEVYAKDSGNIFLVFDFLDVDLEQVIAAKDPARCVCLCLCLCVCLSLSVCAYLQM